MNQIGAPTIFDAHLIRKPFHTFRDALSYPKLDAGKTGKPEFFAGKKAQVPGPSFYFTTAIFTQGLNPNV
ncbi:hypothetical protein [Brucella melitensis]|uniref:hypothetical protein n=1 Tax=Brucella melitensis TaxID=29459 RepID=UPI0012BAD485|nr:hypothetical protein [Brucella melitensis]